jgi:hypothetical protein
MEDRHLTSARFLVHGSKIKSKRKRSYVDIGFTVKSNMEPRVTDVSGLVAPSGTAC